MKLPRMCDLVMNLQIVTYGPRNCQALAFWSVCDGHHQFGDVAIFFCKCTSRIVFLLFLEPYLSSSLTPKISQKKVHPRDRSRVE
jgi:hypothetical protein